MEVLPILLFVVHLAVVSETNSFGRNRAAFEPSKILANLKSRRAGRDVMEIQRSSPGAGWPILRVRRWRPSDFTTRPPLGDTWSDIAGIVNGFYEFPPSAPPAPARPPSAWKPPGTPWNPPGSPFAQPDLGFGESGQYGNPWRNQNAPTNKRPCPSKPKNVGFKK